MADISRKPYEKHDIENQKYEIVIINSDSGRQ